MLQNQRGKVLLTPKSILFTLYCQFKHKGPCPSIDRKYEPVILIFSSDQNGFFRNTLPQKQLSSHAFLFAPH